LSELFPEPPVIISPPEDIPTGDAALQLLEQQLATFPSQADLVVTAPQAVPIGRSWAYDFVEGKFITSVRARGALGTRDLATLKTWIEKALRTARGAHPVSPPGYGMLPPTSADLVGMQVGIIPADIEDRVRDAVTFHPRIVDATDFAYAWSDDDDFLLINFSAILDDQTAVPFRTNLSFTF
jgi:hypothetical protein